MKSIKEFTHQSDKRHRRDINWGVLIMSKQCATLPLEKQYLTFNHS